MCYFLFSLLGIPTAFLARVTLRVVYLLRGFSSTSFNQSPKVVPQRSTAVGLTVNMDFIKPEAYQNVNQAHQAINKRVLADYIQFYGDDAVLNGDSAVVVDFGCGTGETTSGMASGVLASTPKKVNKVDKKEVVLFVKKQAKVKGNQGR